MKNKIVKTIVLNGLMAFSLICSPPFVYAGAEAKTPDQLIKNLLESAQKSDVDGFLSNLTTDSRKVVVESYANQTLLRHAQEEFQSALDERFGKGAEILTTPPDNLKAAIGRLSTIDVITQKQRPDGSLELHVKTSFKTENRQAVSREDTLVAHQEGDIWRLSLGFAANRRIAHGRKAAAERIIQEVRNGKYKDRLSAMLALENAWTSKEGAQP